MKAKMYALRMLSDGDMEQNELKGKGIPSRVLKATKTFNDYKKMLTEPRKDWVEFRRIGSKRLKLTHFSQRKTGLGPYDDKIFQTSAWHSRPLGHWRNRGVDINVTRTSPPILTCAACPFDDAVFVAIDEEQDAAEITSASDSDNEELEDLFCEDNYRPSDDS